MKNTLILTLELNLAPLTHWESLKLYFIISDNLFFLTWGRPIATFIRKQLTVQFREPFLKKKTYIFGTSTYQTQHIATNNNQLNETLIKQTHKQHVLNQAYSRGLDDQSELSARKRLQYSPIAKKHRAACRTVRVRRI